MLAEHKDHMGWGDPSAALQRDVANHNHLEGMQQQIGCRSMGSRQSSSQEVRQSCQMDMPGPSGASPHLPGTPKSYSTPFQVVHTFVTFASHALLELFEVHWI